MVQGGRKKFQGGQLPPYPHTSRAYAYQYSVLLSVAGKTKADSEFDFNILLTQ